MKIVALQAENFKKLTAVSIKPDGNIVEITGKNGQGKTSVLDAIWVALGGFAAAPIAPIRNGAEQATIRLDMGEIVVTRTFKPSKDGEKITSTLQVENAEGARYSSPQAMLDKLLGALTFDPLGFARMDAKDQFNVLRKFVPGVDFDAYDKANLDAFNQRTVHNRKAKEARAAAAQITIAADLPETPIDETALVAELETAGATNADIEVRKANRERMRAEANQQRTLAAERSRQAADLQERIAALSVEANSLNESAKAIDDKLAGAGPLATPIDTSEVRKRIESARSVNGQIAQRKLRDQHIETAKTHEAESDKLSTAMTERDADKKAKVAAAKLPVDGLGFGDGMITLNGVPFSQGSDAEQLSASVAMAMAMNPKLRVIRVRDGSLLDEDSMRLLGEMATAHDYQVWVERVDSSGKVGFVLEDGHIKQRELNDNGNADISSQGIQRNDDQGTSRRGDDAESGGAPRSAEVDQGSASERQNDRGSDGGRRQG